MIPRACRTCGEPLQEQGGQGCACDAEGGAAAGAGGGGAPGRERRLVRPYVMKAPGAGAGPGEPRDEAGYGLPVPYGSAPPPRTEGQGPPVPPGGTDTLATDTRPMGTLPVGAAPEGPADADLGLFADDRAAPGGPYDAEDLRDPNRPNRPHHPRGRRAARRRRRVTLVLTVGGVVAALSVGLLGSGLFSDDGGGDRAVPKPDIISAVPTGGDKEPGPEDTRSDAPSASASGEDDAEPSANSSDRPRTGAGDPGAESTRRSEAGQVTAAPPAADPTEEDDPTSGTTPGGRDEPARPPTLRDGDTGREVVELQKRLIQADYNGLKDTDGEYDFFLGEEVARFQWDNDITSDERAVYGPATRRKLESMTKEP